MHCDKYQGRKEDNMESEYGNAEGRGTEDAQRKLGWQKMCGL